MLVRSARWPISRSVPRWLVMSMRSSTSSRTRRSVDTTMSPCSCSSPLMMFTLMHSTRLGGRLLPDIHSMTRWNVHRGGFDKRPSSV